MLLGEKGWFANRLTYIKQCRKANEAAAILPNEEENDEANPSEDLKLLKTICIDKCSHGDLIMLLNSTRGLRKDMMKVKETDLRENFPFFFIKPALVSFNSYPVIATCFKILSQKKFQLIHDYDEQFKGKPNNAFLNEWPKYATCLREHANNKFGCEKHTDWCDEIENLLLLIKMLPPVKLLKQMK